MVTRCATGKPTASIYNTVLISVHKEELVSPSSTRNPILRSLHQKLKLVPNDES